MIDRGYVQIHRKVQDSIAMSDPMSWFIWSNLILDANWKRDHFQGEAVQRGELVFSYRGWAAKHRISPTTLQKWIREFECEGMIECRQVGKFTIMKIVKYNEYNRPPKGSVPANDTEADQTVPPNDTVDDTTVPAIVPANGTQKAETVPAIVPANGTSQRIKNRRKKEGGARTHFVPPAVEEVATYCRERKNGIDPHRFVDHYESNGWKVGRNPMKDWRAAVRTWERNGLDAQSNGDAQSTPASPPPPPRVRR